MTVSDPLSAPAKTSGRLVVDGVPVPDTMGVATVRLFVPTDLRVELTNVVVRAEAGNASYEGQVAQVGLDPGVAAPRDGAWPLQILNGANLTVHYRLHDDGTPYVEAGTELNLTLEVWWRYESGPRFDGGKVRLQRNVTVQPATDGTEASVANGTLVTQIGDGPRVRVREVPRNASIDQLRVFVVGSDGSAATAKLTPDGDGTATANLTGPLPSDTAYAALVGPWPAPDDGLPKLLVVAGPDGVERVG